MDNRKVEKLKIEKDGKEIQGFSIKKTSIEDLSLEERKVLALERIATALEKQGTTVK